MLEKQCSLKHKSASQANDTRIRDKLLVQNKTKMSNPNLGLAKPPEIRNLPPLCLEGVGWFLEGLGDVFRGVLGGFEVFWEGWY